MWGDQGSMHLIGYDWEPAAVDIGTKANEGVRRECVGAGDYAWAMGAAHVGECLARGSEPVVRVDHCLHVLEVIEAARASSAQGRRVELSSTWPLPALDVA
ncbi:MAG: hypothetical protein ACOYEV_13130 [Candidatus Nanopelagicales bacterium]